MQPLEFLVHVIRQIPETRHNVICQIEDAPVTLGFLAHDYVVHLRHHLGSIIRG
jgi:hypothetical protein